MKSKTITIRVDQDLYQKFFDMAKSEAVTLSELARKAVDDICHQTSSERHQNLITKKKLNGLKANLKTVMNKLKDFKKH